MPNRQHRLPRWQWLTLVSSGLALLASGLVWLGVHYSIGAGTGELPHPSEAWAMRVHGMAAFVGLFLIGALAGAHIPHGWRMSSRQRWARQRGTGLALCCGAALLALSGYLLYYFAPEGVRPALGWMHSAVGMAVAAVVIAHGRQRVRPGRD